MRETHHLSCYLNRCPKKFPENNDYTLVPLMVCSFTKCIDPVNKPTKHEAFISQQNNMSHLPLPVLLVLLTESELEDLLRDRDLGPLPGDKGALLGE